MRWLWLLCAGCGRLGFDSASVTNPDATDAPATIDSQVTPPDGEPDAFVDTTLLVHFKLDDFAGTMTQDINGAIASCTDAADCPTVVAGAHGNALRFDGNDTLRIAYDPSYEAPAEFTIALWFFCEGFDGAVFSRPLTPDVWNTWQLEVVGGKAAFTTSDGLGAHEKLEAPTALPTNQWSHIAGVWTGTQKRIYVNGVLASTSAWTTLSTEPLPIVVGFDVNGGIDMLHVTGGIDELRLYSRALADAEVAELAQ